MNSESDLNYGDREFLQGELNRRIDLKIQKQKIIKIACGNNHTLGML